MSDLGCYQSQSHEILHETLKTYFDEQWGDFFLDII